MINSINEELYQLLLHEILELVNNPEAIAHDYQSLKTQIVRQELYDEIEALFSLLKKGTDVFRQGFLDRCKLRAQQNAGSCLSLQCRMGNVINYIGKLPNISIWAQDDEGKC